MMLQPDPTIRLEVGARPVADFVLTRRIASGSFGEVWQASGPFQVPCALKFIRLLADDGDQQRRARLEVRALDVMKGLGHPHLMRLFGAWERDGFFVVAMELADGTLKDRLDDAVARGLVGIPGDELLKYMHEAAEALDYLNFARQIQHRDVKPLNLLLKAGSLLVGDFGLAKLLEHTQATHTGGMSITYAPPEFFEGEATRWSDQYSLAVTYCQLRGNKLPFTGTAQQVMRGHLEKEPDLSMLPEAERPAVRRALAKQPSQRWPTSTAFVSALERVRGDEPEAMPVLASAARKMAEDDRGWSDLEATPLAAPRSMVNTFGMVFVTLPAGLFLMGSPADEASREDDETPHRVTLTRPFLLGICPVTQAQWRDVMGTNPSHFRGDDRPVEQVSWDDCQRFVETLSARDGRVYRLPTEAEWEYACRAGSTTAFCTGDAEDDLRRVGWFDGNADGGTRPVGSLLPNAWGLYDLHGNVWEWCADYHDAYRGDATDPCGPATGYARVVRGGSWRNGASFCRSAYRGSAIPTLRGPEYGCRLVLEASAATR